VDGNNCKVIGLGYGSIGGKQGTLVFCYILEFLCPYGIG